jgi:tRNA(fMet)-specific endonuclease VapC
MSNRYLLDTNAAIALLNGNISAEGLVGEADEIFTCAISVGELYFGAEKSARVADNFKRIEQFAKLYPVLPVDQLQVKGRMIPRNDIWIAATALQHNLTVITRDEHFKNVDNLLLAAW